MSSGRAGEVSPSVWLALRAYMWGCVLWYVVWGVEYEGGEMVRFREAHSVRFLEKVLPI